MRRIVALVLTLLIALVGWWQQSGAPASTPTDLPPEARATIDLVQRGGPFPNRRDGITFQNREGRLPAQPQGYYREYTVPTPGAADRGARRLIVGGNPPVAWYYTSDHYRSFRALGAAP